MALKACNVSLKSPPFKGQTQRRRSWWEERKRKMFPRQGVIDLSSRQIGDLIPVWPTNYLNACDLPDYVGSSVFGIYTINNSIVKVTNKSTFRPSYLVAMDRYFFSLINRVSTTQKNFGGGLFNQDPTGCLEMFLVIFLNLL